MNWYSLGFCFTLLFNFYWRIIDLQCYISFCCTAKYQLYMFIYPFFFRFFSHISHYQVLSRIPFAIQWKWKLLSNVRLLQPHGVYSPRNSPGQNIEVGSLSLLQRIFPTQGSNPGLPHCRRILYQLSHKGSPRIQEWVAYPFSSGSSQLRNWTRVSCISDRFFTNWAVREGLANLVGYYYLFNI